MRDFIKRYNELWLLPIALVLWLLSTPILHSLDETAATYDIAVFQKLIFGMIVFAFATANVWFMLKLVFPKIFKYLTEEFDTDFYQLNPNQKCVKLVISLAVFALFLLGFLLAMQTL